MPNGTYINWSTDITKRTRLLDWLDANKRERLVLFNPYHKDVKDSEPNMLTKKMCATKAAVAIFSRDENPDIRRSVEEDPEHFGKIVLDYIRSRLKKKYMHFNSQIGPFGARTPYKSLEVGGPLHTKIEQLMKDEFPEWSRLHKYWRTEPFFNQYWKGNGGSTEEIDTLSSANSKGSKARVLEVTMPALKETPKKTKVPMPDFLNLVDDDDNDIITIVEEYDTPPPTVRKDLHKFKREEKKPLILLSTPKTVPYRSTTTPAHHHKRARSEGESDDDTIIEGDKSLTAAQRHELYMARVQLKRQRLEVERQVQKDAADIQKARLEAEAIQQRQKNKMVMQLMAFATGTSGVEKRIWKQDE